MKDERILCYNFLSRGFAEQHPDQDITHSVSRNAVFHFVGRSSFSWQPNRYKLCVTDVRVFAGCVVDTSTNGTCSRIRRMHYISSTAKRQCIHFDFMHYELIHCKRRATKNGRRKCDLLGTSRFKHECTASVSRATSERNICIKKYVRHACDLVVPTQFCDSSETT